MNKFDDYILKQRAEYHKIVSVDCKVLSGEKVFFNRHGLNHLVRKEGHNRTIIGQKRKFKLLKHCRQVLESENAEIEYRTTEKNKIKAEFWGIVALVDGRRIKVVLRKINGGRLIFLSIMDIK